MRRIRQLEVALLLVAALAALPAAASAQTVNGAIIGVVKDTSGAVVPDVAVTLRNIARDEMVGTTVDGRGGQLCVPQPGAGDVRGAGHQGRLQPRVVARRRGHAGPAAARRCQPEAGGVAESVEVIGGSSVLGTTATQEHGIAPETLNQLPLLFGTGPRAAATFALLMPGVSTGAGNNAFDARVNGGMQSGDEASVDGVSMQQGFMSQGGMVSILQDFPMSPDMVSQIKVLTSGYAPEYGSSTGGQIMAVTKSGGTRFHGAAFESNQNSSRNAVQWGKEKTELKKDNNGANVGGPIPLPGFSNDRWKSFFYFDYERYRQKGGASQNTLSIPSLQERQGDFRDWRDPRGNLIPIYDPATLRPDGERQLHQESVHGLRRQDA